MDGGMGTELCRLGAMDFGFDGWSQVPFETEEGHQRIIDAHLNFLQAGAKIISTHTYALHPLFYSSRNLILPNFQIRLHLAYTLAKIAAEMYEFDNPQDKIQIAGSIGPYSTCAEPGADYSFDYSNTSIEDLRLFHREKTEILHEFGVDILLFETISSMKEAIAIRDILLELNLTGWISFTCKENGMTANGDDFEEIVKFVNDTGCFQVLGVNCSTPTVTLDCLQIASLNSSMPLCAYPNNGYWDQSQQAWTSGDPNEFRLWGKSAMKYCNFIGGCCCVSSSAIKSISSMKHV